MTDEKIRLILELTGAKDIDGAVASLESLKTKSKEAADSQAGLGRGALQASYAFQDFTSVLSGGGGFGRALSSIQNNIPILLSSLGLGAGLTGVVSVATVALGLFIDKMLASSDKGKDLKQQITAIAQEIDGYRQKQTLLNEDVEKYVELLQRQKDAEAEARREKQATAAWEEHESPDARRKERAALMEQMLSGRKAETMQALLPGIGREMTRQGEDLTAQRNDLRIMLEQELRGKARPAIVKPLQDLIGIINQKLKALPGEAIPRLETLMGQGLTGDAAAIEHLRRLAAPESTEADIFRLAGVGEQRSRRKEAHDIAEAEKRRRQDEKNEQERRTAIAQVQRNIDAADKAKMAEAEQQAAVQGRLSSELEREQKQKKEQDERKAEKAARDAETEHRKAVIESKRRDEAQAMQESRELVAEAFAQKGVIPNPQQLESAARDALRRFNDLGNGMLQAQLAAQASIDQLNAAIATVQGRVQMMRPGVNATFQATPWVGTAGISP